MVRKAEKGDTEILAELAALLWSGSSADELLAEFSEIISEDNVRFFIKYEEDIPVGFAQCVLRHDYVEGTKTTPVGYLEGIFIKDGYRRRGYARELLAECEAWARQKGCREFAGDCEMDNISSFRFHKAMNFIEANRIICFVKTL